MSVWITAKEAMSRAGRGRTWLDNRASAGLIRRQYSYETGRRRPMYHADDLMRVLDEEGHGKVAPPSEKAHRKLIVQVPPLGARVDVLRRHGDGPISGRVVERYPRFAVVEFPQGYRESFFYEDLSSGEVVRRAG